MTNKVKNINKTNHTYYFFDDIMNIKNFDLNKKHHTKIFVFTILDM